MNDMINERDKEFANEFSRFVNGKMCSASKVGAEFANDHRFLVVYFQIVHIIRTVLNYYYYSLTQFILHSHDFS